MVHGVFLDMLDLVHSVVVVMQKYGVVAVTWKRCDNY